MKNYKCCPYSSIAVQEIRIDAKCNTEMKMKHQEIRSNNLLLLYIIILMCCPHSYECCPETQLSHIEQGNGVID